YLVAGCHRGSPAMTARSALSEQATISCRPPAFSAPGKSLSRRKNSTQTMSDYSPDNVGLKRTALERQEIERSYRVSFMAVSSPTPALYRTAERASSRSRPPPSLRSDGYT